MFGFCKHQIRSNLLKGRVFKIRLLGVDDGNPTVEVGDAGVTVTRTGEGAYLVTFDDAPGVYSGWGIDFIATTPADLKGYSAVAGVYNSTTNAVAFVIYNASNNAADLIAAQFAYIAFEFGS